MHHKNHSSDNVSGFTNEYIFNSMTQEVIDIPLLRTTLWNENSTAPGIVTTEADYLILFNSYGY